LSAPFVERSDVRRESQQPARAEADGSNDFHRRVKMPSFTSGCYARDKVAQAFAAQLI